jgi:hypothetical protein
MTLSVKVLRRLLIFLCMIGHVTWRHHGGEIDGGPGDRELFGWAVRPADCGPHFPVFNILLSCTCRYWNSKRAKRAGSRGIRRLHCYIKFFNMEYSFSCKVCLLKLVGQSLPPVTTSIYSKL